MVDLNAVADVVAESADVLRSGSHDLTWQSTFDSREELVVLLEERANALRSGDDSSLAQVKTWFLPTGPVCEIAASSGWLPEYTELGNRLDAILAGDGESALPPNDRPLAILSLFAQCLLLAVGYGLAQLSKLDDSNCSFRPGDGYADCGDPAWPDRAAMTSVIGGGLLILLTVVGIGGAATSDRRSLPIAICGLSVHAVLLCVTIGMAAQFGP